MDTVNATAVISDLREPKDVDHSSVIVTSLLDLSSLRSGEAPAVKLQNAITFEDCTFRELLTAGDVPIVFEKPVLFRSCCFQNGVSLQKCRFLDGMRFEFCTFHRDVSFRDIEVTGRTSFFGSRFPKAEERADLIFTGSTFSGDFEFGDTIVEANAWFKGVRVSGAAGFARARFTGKLTFGREFLRGTRFSSEADFRWSEMKNPDFQEVTFAGPAQFDLASLTGTKVLFTEARFSDVSFRETEFPETVDFDAVEASGVVNLQTKPPAEGLSISKETRLGQTELDWSAWRPSAWSWWVPFWYQNLTAVDSSEKERADQRASLIAFLKSAEKGASADDDDYAANQLAYRRQVLERKGYGPIPRAFEAAFLDWVFGYGVRLANPLAIIIITLAVFTGILWCFNIRFQPGDQATPKLEQLPLSYVPQIGSGYEEAGFWARCALAFQILTKVGFAADYKTDNRYCLWCARVAWFVGLLLMGAITICIVSMFGLLDDVL